MGGEIDLAQEAGEAAGQRGQRKHEQGTARMTRARARRVPTIAVTAAHPGRRQQEGEQQAQCDAGDAGRVAPAGEFPGERAADGMPGIQFHVPAMRAAPGGRTMVSRRRSSTSSDALHWPVCTGEH